MSVLGLDVVLANLERIGAEIVTGAEPEGLAAAGEDVRAAWVDNIESEGLVLTGHYRDSVRVELEGDVASVYTDVPYAGVLEYGDSHIAPHPVAERAFDEHHERATEILGDAITRVVR